MKGLKEKVWRLLVEKVELRGKISLVNGGGHDLLASLKEVWAVSLP